jgi:hypothetical protein
MAPSFPVQSWNHRQRATPGSKKTPPGRTGDDILFTLADERNRKPILPFGKKILLIGYKCRYNEHQFHKDDPLVRIGKF